MPTAFEYEWWATWFTDRADEMSTLLSGALGAATADVLAGGSLAVTVDVALRASADNATTVSTKLLALADECTDRARACREHDAAMTRFETAEVAYDAAILRYVEAAEVAHQQHRPFHGSPPRAPSRPTGQPTWWERTRE